MSDPSDPALTHFLHRWRSNEGGAERANYVLFLTELCRVLDLPQPDPAGATRERNDYVFERAVTVEEPDGRVTTRRIDLYRRGCFVLEAKQSREPGGAKEVALPPDQATLPGFTAPRSARRASRGWDVLMRNAQEQAREYAQALPADHGWPPFLIVCDVGHAFELFADFSGQGKNYRQFPDRAGYRIFLDDLADPAIRKRLRQLWLNPLSLDPTRRAAAVTRDIAARLAAVSRLLEARGREPGEVAHFLMRCLFTMYAEEDKVRLLPPGSFTAFLRDARDHADSFAPLLEELWLRMNEGGVSALLRERVRHFNGGLFRHARAIPLNREEIGELYEAARHDWSEVEPAIFGTLLEQALDKRERRRLGAHYTPRVYVERLVTATIIEPLQREWTGPVLGAVERERAGNPAAAIAAVRAFHTKLARTTVLDPACGTGNFLYVALELLKRLEGEVLEVLAELGGQEALALETETVHPRNFHGIELNARAAAIAELVLWLGHLQWQLRNGAAISDPVLEERDTVRAGDAVLRHDDERFAPDGTSLGLANPRRPDWPDVDYIVGNPPFIGGKDLRGRLGDAYAQALWRAHPKMGRSADFVMYWWDRAAERLTEAGSRLKRFGLVTTNSITQEFSRRVIARRLDARAPVSLVLAIPDHPWTKATRDAAAVRIAMTVAEAGAREGAAMRVTGEAGLDTDTPEIAFERRDGRINADLTVGADLTGLEPLRANEWLSFRGVTLIGKGFIVSRSEACALGLGRREGLEKHIREYRNGRDLTGRPRNVLVIDLYGLSSEDVRRRFPEIYQHLKTEVKEKVDPKGNKVGRDWNNRAAYRERWWVFGEPRGEQRPSLVGLGSYIVTTQTAKHRSFQKLPSEIIPDQQLIVIASEDDYMLGVVSSRIHLAWTEAIGGTLEDRERYNNSLVFDPFPFPAATPDQRAAIGDLAEELDGARKDVLALHPDLTLTGLYNLRAKLMHGEAFTVAEADARARGRVDLLAELHDRIDAAVAEAYGWPADLGAEAIVAWLVALHAERRAEERVGRVRWLRPDYQLGRAGGGLVAAAGPEQIEAALPPATARRPAFPRDAIGQTAAVLDALRAAGAQSAAEVAGRFAQGRRVEGRIAATLAALARLGHLSGEGDRFRLRRAA